LGSNKRAGGYESDTDLIIRKREDTLDSSGVSSPPPPLLSPSEQRHMYVEIQKGGEVPLHGLRKPAPEKPKGKLKFDILCDKVFGINLLVF